MSSTPPSSGSPPDIEVILRPVSDWQKPDCINQTPEFHCPNEAVMEAHVARGGLMTTVRACHEQECLEVAVRTARDWMSMMMNAIGRE